MGKIEVYILIFTYVSYIFVIDFQLKYINSENILWIT